MKHITLNELQNILDNSIGYSYALILHTEYVHGVVEFSTAYIENNKLHLNNEETPISNNYMDVNLQNLEIFEEHECEGTSYLFKNNRTTQHLQLLLIKERNK